MEFKRFVWVLLFSDVKWLNKLHNHIRKTPLIIWFYYCLTVCVTFGSQIRVIKDSNAPPMYHVVASPVYGNYRAAYYTEIILLWSNSFITLLFIKIHGNNTEMKSLKQHCRQWQFELNLLPNGGSSVHVFHVELKCTSQTSKNPDWCGQASQQS